MKFRLFIQLPKTAKIGILGTLSIDRGEAHFFEDDRLKNVLHKPEIMFINPDGLMLKGYQPDGFDKTGRSKYKYQEWFCRYAPAPDAASVAKMEKTK